MKPTGARVRELFDYDPTTGVFTRLIDNGGGSRVGDRAGYCDEGRWKIAVDGRRYQAAQLAWLYMTGEWPTALVDHRDRNHSDDRWENLRLASKAQNAINSTKARRALPRGVYRRGNRFQARIKNAHLGMFATVDAASAAFQAESRRRYGEFSPWQ